jgi:hypothetical protein
MRWSFIALIASLIVACGVDWPDLPWPDYSWPDHSWHGFPWPHSSEETNECAGTDYTILDTCEGHWIDFIDGNIATAVLDGCDGVNQEGPNPLVAFSPTTGFIADEDDVPPKSRAGADSGYHSGTNLGCPATTALDGEYDLHTYVGWWKSDGVATGVRIRKGPGSGLVAETFYGYCTNAVPPLQKFQLYNLTQSAGGANCPNDQWIFQSGTYDHDVTNTIRTYNSQSGLANSLLECDEGDPETCAVEDWGEYIGLKPMGLGCASNLSNRYKGNVFDVAYFSEVLTPEQVCEICRCGVRGTAEDRKSQCNNCAME